uniref:Leucine zipper protein 2 n=1 Tax=Sphenodon punctatus TaxID=8508 RepID=A0A8D0HG04_SPHPU
ILYSPPHTHSPYIWKHQGRELERQLKEVFKERSNILHQLSKTSKELEGIKVNLQSLKNDEASAKTDVQKLLELGQKQREEMKSLQEAFQKQLNEAVEKAEKQQATINFLKTEMERKSKMIRDLQNENKSLKNKLLSGNKLCGIHAEESYCSGQSGKEGGKWRALVLEGGLGLIKPLQQRTFPPPPISGSICCSSVQVRGRANSYYFGMAWACVVFLLSFSWSCLPLLDLGEKLEGPGLWFGLQSPAWGALCWIFLGLPCSSGKNVFEGEVYGLVYSRVRWKGSRCGKQTARLNGPLV